MKNRVDINELVIEHCLTKRVGNSFTKLLQGAAFYKFCDMIFNPLDHQSSKH